MFFRNFEYIFLFGRETVKINNCQNQWLAESCSTFALIFNFCLLGSSFFAGDLTLSRNIFFLSKLGCYKLCLADAPLMVVWVCWVFENINLRTSLCKNGEILDICHSEIQRFYEVFDRSYPFARISKVSNPVIAQLQPFKDVTKFSQNWKIDFL